ncbi:autotransporter domain-containing protein [Pseudomonas sp. LS44]|uniref:autotransporter outer membrane beta-barrel domain-containing protein n=1 Tax=Pseudomonas sp. LS44 TaxID=1357074 RepID=UPI00215AF5FA|nr:autotransporter domain-containing protein [Pseudomonas sp. LS44]UVE16739.1 autotransporter domain-containing protein [Pseudomonas sp. LS44]
MSARWASAVLALWAGASGAQEGELYASSQSLLLEDSRFVREAALDRLQQIRFAFREPPAEPGQQPLWTRAYGNWGSRDSDGAAARVEHDSGGLFIGADRKLNERWVAGVLGGYSRLDLRLDDRQADADIDSYHLAAYAAMRYYNQLGLKLGAAFSQQRLDSQRLGAHGSTDGYSVQVFTEAIYAMDYEEFTVEAFTNLAYVALRSDGLTEKGGATAQTIASADDHTTVATFGWRAVRGVPLASGKRLVARGSLGWRHAFGSTDVQRDSVSRLDGLASRSAGVPLSEDSLRLDLGLDYEVLPQVYAGLWYVGNFADAARDNGLSARLSLKY